jgi:hypothetical protein
MIQHAAAIGANAIIGVRYDATEIAQGVTEVLCYGTAVYAAPEGSQPYMGAASQHAAERAGAPIPPGPQYPGQPGQPGR